MSTEVCPHAYGLFSSIPELLAGVSSYLCVYNLEFPEDIVWVFIYSMKDNLVLSEIRGSSGWPIPVALYPASFSLFRQHHYCSTLLFPHHSPEVITCVWKWALSSYESLSLVVTLRV